MKPYRPRPWLLPLAALHSAVLRLRHWAFDAGLLRSAQAEIPTWVVGNITVGGTGKSPHVRLVVRELEAAVGSGRVGVLSRGYGRAGQDFAWVTAESEAAEVGDEPRMLKGQIPQAPIAVCADRLEGVRRMHAEHPELRWVVLDDAMQHRRLVPDVTMVLLDATQPVSRDRLIPAGRLRDLRHRLRKAHVAVITRTSGDFEGERAACGWPEHAPLWFTRMTEGRLEPWSAAARSMPVPAPHPHAASGPRVLAVAGIARPERFMDGLAKGYQIVRREAFPDHHAFTEEEVKRWVTAFDTDGIAGVITTEKDAARLEAHRHLLDGVAVYYVPLLAEWADPEAARAWLQETAASVRRNS